MTKERLLKIERDIAENVGWLENGKEVRLSNAAISTIMAIIRVNLKEEECQCYCHIPEDQIAKSGVYKKCEHCKESV